MTENEAAVARGQRRTMRRAKERPLALPRARASARGGLLAIGAAAALAAGGSWLCASTAPPPTPGVATPWTGASVDARRGLVQLLPAPNAAWPRQLDEVEWSLARLDSDHAT